MKKAKWIWYPGDFEIYHHLLLSCRRQEFGCDYPCAWRVSSPEKTVCFVKKFKAKKETVIKVITHSNGMVLIMGKKWQVNTDITVSAGEHTIEVQLYDINAFPSLFIDNEYVVTDETWTCEARDTRWFGVSCDPEYITPDSDPKVFPFCYKAVKPVSVEKINGGLLYDFGRELFGPITILNRQNLIGISLIYGESRKEALDFEWAVIRENLNENDSLKRPSRAFRYIFTKCDSGEDIAIEAEYEYLPVNDIADFECDNPLIKKIWDVCSYTFHLNSREFFLDGIKRDRWVWSGDAYQSFMINRCLFNDIGLTERTITALLGKPPYNMHINRINDYSAYLIISVYEHYLASGRVDFIRKIWENLKSLFCFVLSRLDEQGLSVPRNGDWVFIDWGVLDKEGPHCVEQILLYKVYLVMTELSSLMGENDNYLEKAKALKELINEKYWNISKGSFIDSFSSGKDFVSRQTNVIAVLFDFADENQKKSIIQNVFNNNDLPAITTPYFKLYELLALCKCGMLERAQEYIVTYWGGMLKLGATSVWEAFDESVSGDDHLAMYGTPFAKSLCHAWGSGPILLLISYCMGVHPTSVGYETFDVVPNLGIFKSVKCKAPVRNGYVYLEYNNSKLDVYSTVTGGTLVVNDERIPIDVKLI